MIVRGLVERVDVDNPNIKTPNGAGIGISERELVRLYDGILVKEEGPYRGFTFTYSKDRNQGPASKIIFETDGQRVLRYRAGRVPAVDYIERCL